jgi:pantetheine-phosphate adenylyltransferase
MRRILYPGTFDPITLGHFDVIERAVKLFDEVIVAVAENPNKKPLFSKDERYAMVSRAVAPLGAKVTVENFDGLLVDYAEKKGACALLRGLRAVSDFEFEFQMALMNRQLNPQLETLFLMPKDTYSYLSSSIIKEIARLGGDISPFVPGEVALALKARFKSASGR